MINATAAIHSYAATAIPTEKTIATHFNKLFGRNIGSNK